MSSNKEEDDKAWWSDYQASTKLKRKWNKQKKSDHDDLDDILGDLDDIVNKPDVKAKVSKEKKCDSDDLDDILGDLDDIVNKSDVKVEVPKDVQQSKSKTVGLAMSEHLTLSFVFLQMKLDFLKAVHNTVTSFKSCMPCRSASVTSPMWTWRVRSTGPSSGCMR